MPWKRAKALPPPCNKLFEECFRIQREASEAAGHHIPLIVENVRGAQPWVGRSRWAWGSFHLWGDVPALMPITMRAAKVPMPIGGDSLKIGFQQMAKLQMGGQKVSGFRFDGSGKSFHTAAVNGRKQSGDWFAEARKGGKGGTSASFGSKSTARKMASAMISKIPAPLSRYIAKTFYPINS